MSDMPKVKPRDMHAVVAATASTHQAVRDSIASAASERAKYYDKLNADLNAGARLEGKVKP